MPYELIPKYAALQGFQERPGVIDNAPQYFAGKVPEDAHGALMTRNSFLVATMAFQQFGQPHPFDLWEWTNSTCDEAVKYFTSENSKRYANREWLKIYIDHLLQALLIDHPGLVTLADWYDASRRHEYAGQIDYSIVQVHGLIAHLLTTRTDIDVAALEEKVNAGKATAANRELVVVIRALRERNVAEYQKAMKKAVQTVYKRAEDKVARGPKVFPFQIYGIEVSALWAIATRLGVPNPEMPEEKLTWLFRAEHLNLQAK